ncbi:MAG: hypothetical protein LBM04_13140 [Opitutaceae bacterium]|nr:hypothetical protein [Opitutaceae bacterium]
MSYFSGLHCKAAVKKLTDQDALAHVAKNDESKFVRIVAVKKLTDQAVLVCIAKNDKDSDVRWAAVEKLTDQTLLADIAKYDENKYVCMAAVKKLTDQALLVDVAKNAKYFDVRIAAVEKLTDHALLADIAKNDEDSDVRKAAIIKLINQSHLTEALEGIYCFNFGTVEKIGLAHALVALAKNSDKPLNVQWKAIKDWIGEIPRIPHHDERTGRSSDCTHYDNSGERDAPLFPPYSFES